jgi:hypothetical protein
MAAPTRYAAYEGYLIASDNTYTVPTQTYSSNIKSQMSQAQNVTDWLVARSAIITPIIDSSPASSSMWFLAPTDPTNVSFNTFDETTSIGTGLPQQMSPFIDVNTAVWGIYFPAIPGQGQLAPAYGKIQLYGTKVTGLAGQGNNPSNVTSAAALVALANSIGQKYVTYTSNDSIISGFGGSTMNNEVDVVQQVMAAGGIISLNGAPVYQS